MPPPIRSVGVPARSPGAISRRHADPPEAGDDRGGMRFLIDECLSIDLVLTASQAGHEAQHVARVGKAGWKDWNVARHASEGDFVLVTNNASDFRRLYAAQPLHAGLVIIIPTVNRAAQQRLFRGALDELAGSGEPVNRVLEVDIDGDDVTFNTLRPSDNPSPVSLPLSGRR